MPVKRPKYSLEASHKASILETIASALNRHEEIVVAYVFGSFIHCDTFSDIDIAVLTAEDLDYSLDLELSLEIEIEDIVNYPTDIRVLNRAPLSFCQNIIRNGRVILERDEAKRSDFMGRVLKKYFEFAPFRRRYLREVASAPI